MKRKIRIVMFAAAVMLALAAAGCQKKSEQNQKPFVSEKDLKAFIGETTKKTKFLISQNWTTLQMTG